MNAAGRSLVRAAVIGAATGLRSQSGPAALAWSARTRSGTWSAPWVRGLTATAAAAEFLADKSPRAPSRLGPAGLGPRVVLGAVCGAALARRHRARSPVPSAAVIGAAAAVVSAVAGARWRAAVGGRVAGAVTEDAVTALLAGAACASGAVRAGRAPSAHGGDPGERAGQPTAFAVRAEYAAGASAHADLPRVEVWHMTGEDGARALCGEPLDADAETQPLENWSSAAAEPFCRLCGTHYLRQGA
ncbi:hypothetical protein [Streptomyces sp. NPDC101249]|uniref:hypothetical protein n=1 Tax=Streptomyces sp. NPDC101249 TaxID=3366140 RepID=UPI0038124E80